MTMSAMARSLIEVKDLRYFVALYDAASFSRASISLGTVQSNVSARIAALERQLGVALFERRYRRLVPTASGKKLHRSALALVDSLRALERDAMQWRRRNPPRALGTRRKRRPRLPIRSSRRSKR